nr:symplekin isoform X1 [Tanacetum cinerariifolium]
MVKVYYEEAKRSRHEEPRDMAVNCKGIVERPQVSAKINAEVEMPDETPRKRSRTEWEDVNMEDESSQGGSILTPAQVLIGIYGVAPERDGIPLKKASSFFFSVRCPFYI